MSINNLFETKKVKFFGISPVVKKRYPKYENAYCELYCQLHYGYIDENSNADLYSFTEDFGTEYGGGKYQEANRKIGCKILRLGELFTDNTESGSGGGTRFIDIYCIGIFYNNELIAITNDQGKMCLDPLLKNKAKDIEEFKKEFIKSKEVELEKERYMCEKRVKEICEELSHIIKETL